MRNESDVKKETKKVLTSFGDRLWWYMPVPSGYGTQGIPDFVCCLDGMFVGIETKFGANGLSRWQVKQRDDMSKAGGAFYTITEKNVHELESMLLALLALRG